MVRSPSPTRSWDMAMKRRPEVSRASLRQVVRRPPSRCAMRSMACWAQSDALDGEQLLGIDGPVDGDKGGAEAVVFLEVFEADDGEVRCGEAMLAGVPRGAGFALGSAGTGGMGRIRP